MSSPWPGPDGKATCLSHLLFSIYFLNEPRCFYQMSNDSPNKHPRLGWDLESHRKHLFDYLKHMTTLSTGSILLQLAFLEKVFSQPRWKGLVAISLVSFSASIIGAVVVHTTLMGTHIDSAKWERTEKRVVAFALLSVWLGFLAGVVTLVIFALRNLFI